MTDQAERLTSVLSLRQLLTVPPSTPLQSIMTKQIMSLTPEMDQEEVARLVAAYNLLAIPVLDSHKCCSALLPWMMW